MPGKENSGARIVYDCVERQKTQLEQQSALNVAGRKGVHKGGVKCAKLEVSVQEHITIRSGLNKIGEFVIAKIGNESYTPRDVNAYLHMRWREV